MKNNNRIILIIIGISVIGLILMYFIGNFQDQKKYRWIETYENDSVEPYGTYLIYELLKDKPEEYQFFTSNGKSIQDQINPEVEGKSTYVFIGNELIESPYNFDSLLSFVAKGNNAFISTNYKPGGLMSFITNELCHSERFDYFHEPAVNLKFVDSTEFGKEKYTYEFLYKWKQLSYDWNFFDSIACDQQITLLGIYDNDRANFISIPYENGTFYFHSTPIAFSNFYMREEVGLAYADNLFSYLNDGNIYWDEHSRLLDNFNYNPNRETPLQFVLSDMSLKWGWYFILLITLIYVFFRSKRKQRIIPVLKIPENTSIEFTETIGELYYQQNDHRKLALLKMKMFLTYIRNHYFLSTNEINEELINKICAKSQVAPDVVSSIFSIFNRVQEVTDVSESLLVNFHNKIQYFYNHCK